MEIQIKIKVLFLGHESISVSCVGNFFERALCWEISERALCWEFFLGGRVVLTLGGMGCTNADLSPKISRHMEQFAIWSKITQSLYSRLEIIVVHFRVYSLGPQ